MVRKTNHNESHDTGRSAKEMARCSGRSTEADKQLTKT